MPDPGGNGVTADPWSAGGLLGAGAGRPVCSRESPRETRHRHDEPLHARS